MTNEEINKIAQDKVRIALEYARQLEILTTKLVKLSPELNREISRETLDLIPVKDRDNYARTRGNLFALLEENGAMARIGIDANFQH